MRSRRPALLLVAGAVLTLAGCSSTPEPAAVAASPTPAAPSSSSPTPSPTPTPSATPTAVPSFDRTATPATTSGSLKRASLPLAPVLGSGWRSRVDGGSVEDGYTGNGTPSVARDPEDTVIAMRPIGCAEESVYAEPLSVPRYALEVDYRHRTGANGVGLALEFRDAAAASDFFAVYTRSLALCRSGESGATRVTVQAAPGTDAMASITVDPLEQTTWRELAERSGRVVRLLAVEGTAAPVRAWGAVLTDLRGA